MPLGEIVDVRMGHSFRSRLDHDPSGDTSVIQMKDLDSPCLNSPDGLTRTHLPELHPKHLVHPGDLLVRSRGGAFLASLVTGELGRAVLMAPMFIIRARGAKIDPAYLHWFINHPDTQRQLVAHASGTSVKMLGKPALEQLEVPLPPLDVQQRIAQVSHLAEREDELIRRLTECRKLVMDQTLIRVADPARGSSAPHQASNQQSFALKNHPKENTPMPKKSSTPPTLHVVPNPNGGWDNKKAGADRASTHHETKREAIDTARKMSQREESELKIHNLNGQIAQSDSHGHDPRNIPG